MKHRSHSGSFSLLRSDRTRRRCDIVLARRYVTVIAAASLHKRVWKLFKNRKQPANVHSFRRNWAGVAVKSGIKKTVKQQLSTLFSSSGFYSRRVLCGLDDRLEMEQINFRFTLTDYLALSKTSCCTNNFPLKAETLCVITMARSSLSGGSLASS